MDWLYFVCFLIIGAPLTLILHELSHAIVAWAAGAEVVLFKLWPHKVEERWYFGRIVIKKDDETFSAGLFYAAPYWKALCLCLAWAFIGQLWWPLLAFAVWEWIDIAWWYKGYYFGPDHLDGRRWRDV